MRALLATLLVLVPTLAAAEVEVLGVESATGGIWREGRFSPIRLRARAPAGDHEVRARLEPGKIVVETLRSAGGEATVLLPLLPEADADGVEIDVGVGWTRHEVRLRRHEGDRLVVGVVEGLAGRPEVVRRRRALGWTEIAMPAGPSRALRDVCDVVLEDPAAARLDAALGRGSGGPVLSGPRVVGWLEEHAAGAEVGPDGVRTALPLLAIATALLLALVIYGRGRGWPATVVVAAATGLQAAVLLAGWVAFESGDDLPRATARGFAVVRADGDRTDLLVLSGRGRATVRFDAGEHALLRPLAGDAGRVGGYTLRGGRVLEGVALGRGRRRYVRIDRAPAIEIRRRVLDGGVVDAYRFDSGGARAMGEEERLTPEAVWDRFRTPDPDSPLGPRGILLRRIARPALVPGIYGFLRDPLPLHGPSMGVERAEILHALLVP